MRVWLMVFSCFILPLAAASESRLVVNGKLQNEQQQPINGATIKVGKQQVLTDKQGHFTLTLLPQKYYQISMQADGYYPKTHHFNLQELTSSQQQMITLVKKATNRTMFTFAGDAMMGRRYHKPMFDDPVLIDNQDTLGDAQRILAHVKPYLEVADIAVVNLESQVADSEPSTKAKKSVTFYSPPETIAALKWAGIDYVTLGNNHSYDYLDEGLMSTLEMLEEQSLPFSGAGMTEQQALAPFNLEHKDATYAMLGYVGWKGSKKPYQAATKEQGGAAYGSMENIVDGVKLAKSNTSIPIVQYHGSLEYSNEPTGVTEQRLKSAIDHGAALAVAHHPHVTQGIELYKGSLIAYSMGNFIFDQNFSSTQLSMLLNVWLDDGKFHRAEIVPIYVKGYKPTPALGIERDNLLQRLVTLSAKRNTQIKIEAGHGVITGVKSEMDVDASTTKLIANGETTHLIKMPFAGAKISTINLPSNDLAYRLGTNLVNGSDFENFDSFNTLERGFSYDKQNAEYIETGYQSKGSLLVNVPAESNQTVGMKHFRRVYLPSNPVTFKTYIKANQNLTMNLYWQGRKTRQKLKDAFDNSPKTLIKSVDLKGTSAWQSVEVDFNSPRIGYRSYRVIAEFINESDEIVEMAIDDFSVIQWHTAFQTNETPMLTDDGGKMANYIGFKQPLTQKVNVNFE